jgi:FAD/FMN-containing dehydrogenase
MMSVPASTPVARREQVAAALRARLPDGCVLSDPEDTRPYECDGLAAYRQLPMVVTLPRDEAEVLAVLNVCRQLQVPIVPRGAGTGLSGGAMPIADGVVISTARLNRIVRLDAYSRTAVVQPGVRNLAISEAAGAHGLYYAPDPSSQIACTIGGNVAENSGGVHCLKYGLTVHNVLRVRMVTIDGGDYLRLVGRQHHHHGQLAEGRQAVAFVRPGIFLVEQHRAPGQDDAQRIDDFTLACKGRLRSFWSIHGMGPDRRWEREHGGKQRA